MSMSKRDFIALADVMREELQSIERATFEASVVSDTIRKQAMREKTYGTIQRLADFCQSQNANFMRDRWLAYIAGECGPNGGNVKPPKQQRESRQLY